MLSFKLIFSSVFFITLLAGGTSCWLASQTPLSAEQDRIFETSTTTCQMGACTIFGLLGGKTTQRTQSRDEED